MDSCNEMRVDKRTKEDVLTVMQEYNDGLITMENLIEKIGGIYLQVRP